MNALQLLEKKHNHVRMRESLRVRIEILRRHLSDEESRPPGAQIDFVVRQVWGSTTMILEQARPIFADEPETVALLDEVETLNNRLGRLIS